VFCIAVQQGRQAPAMRDGAINNRRKCTIYLLIGFASGPTKNSLQRAIGSKNATLDFIGERFVNVGNDKGDIFGPNFCLCIITQDAKCFFT
jgi:hypothetical protein